VSDENGNENEAVADEPVNGVNGDASGPPAAEPTVEALLEAAEQQAAEYLDGWQRARAEFDNARKRMDRERLEARANATIDLVRTLLPIIDDFGRASDNVPDAIAADAWFEGIGLVQRKLMALLEKYRIEPISTVGQPFDPNIHEAVTQEPSDVFESGTVTRELQAGYKLGDRVIRAALVCVAL
jgi:molecular chaperone GrpE